MQPVAQDVANCIPPPLGFIVPSQFTNQKHTPEDLIKFEDRVKNSYYCEFFWFPYQSKAWVNCWKNNGKKEDAKDYPCPLLTKIEKTENYLAGVVQSKLFKYLPGKKQAEIFGVLAMTGLPKGETEVTYLIDALHFRRGIHNMRVMDIEAEIPIPPKKDNPNEPDLDLVRQAWWDAIKCVESDPKAPMRTTLEMRIMGGSNILMAPQADNQWTCSIEVLTNMNTDRKTVWEPFGQRLLDTWASYKDDKGQPLKVRLHWAKEWQQYTIHGKPIIDYYTTEAYKVKIDLFKNAMAKIAENGKTTVKNNMHMFSNPLLDQVFAKLLED